MDVLIWALAGAFGGFAVGGVVVWLLGVRPLSRSVERLRATNAELADLSERARGVYERQIRVVVRSANLHAARAEERIRDARLLGALRLVQARTALAVALEAYGRQVARADAAEQAEVERALAGTSEVGP